MLTEQKYTHEVDATTPTVQTATETSQPAKTPYNRLNGLGKMKLAVVSAEQMYYALEGQRQSLTKQLIQDCAEGEAEHIYETQEELQMVSEMITNLFLQVKDQAEGYEHELQGEGLTLVPDYKNREIANLKTMFKHFADI